MNRRNFSKLLGVLPSVVISKDKTLYSLISGKNGDLRITSYDRTGQEHMSVYYDLTKADSRSFDSIEKEIIKIAESVDWVVHFAELYLFGPDKDLAHVTIQRLFIYKDSFGVYRYRTVKDES